MKPLKKIAFVILLALSFASCTPEDSDIDTFDTSLSPKVKQIETEILQLINTYRVQQGLEALETHTTVKAVAYSHTEYMLLENNVSHDNFFERKRNLQNHANAHVVSENVAYGYISAESVVNAWLRSPGHKANIVGDFSHFDISAEQNDAGKWYFTNIFIKQ